MKKLIIVLAAVALATGVQASSVKWSISNIYEYGSTTDKAAKGSYYVMCFIGSDSASLSDKVYSLADATAAAAAGKLSDLAGKAVYAGTLTLKGQYTSAKYDLGWDGGDTVGIYAIVFDAATPEAATHYAISSSMSTVTFDDNAQDKTLSVSMAGASYNPTSVPEPTSGLLMLLGMAGLALRRKRA